MKECESVISITTNARGFHLARLRPCCSTIRLEEASARSGQGVTVQTSGYSCHPFHLDKEWPGFPATERIAALRVPALVSCVSLRPRVRGNRIFHSYVDAQGIIAARILEDRT